MVLLALSLLMGVALAGLASGLLLFWRLPADRQLARSGQPAGRLASADTLSIIIPARNEEHALPTLLASLRDQVEGREGCEVVVVDDESQDATARVAASFGCRVIATGQRPPGWIGKSWACWRGAEETSGSLLLFLDADTRIEPGGLSRLLALRGEGLLSLQPYHRMERTVERLSALFNLTVMGATGAFTAWRRAPDGAFGPCMLLSREEYLRAGGHQGVRGSLIEDMALGRACRDRSIPVTLGAGRGIVSYRMYPRGLREIVEGWTKNLTVGAKSAPRPISLLLGLWLTGGIAATLLALFAIWAALAGASTALLAWPAAVVYLLTAASLARALGAVGNFGPLVALLFPLPLLFFFLVFFRSLSHHRFRGSVQWKGRRIEVEK